MSSRTRNFVQIACWLEPGLVERLARISAAKGLTKQELLRRAVRQLVRRYEASNDQEY